MLELIFQNLIEEILKVQNSHKESSDEKTMLSLNWEFIFSDFHGWVVLYCSTSGLSGYWIYPMLCPNDHVDSLKANLPNFSIMPSSSAYSQVMCGDDHWIEPYWGNVDDFRKTEIPLLFMRQYYGYPDGQESYFEFNQLVTHSLELHRSQTKDSYCIVDEQGEEVEKIKVIKDDKVKLILIRRKTLDKLLYLGKWVLVRYVQFNRRRSNNPFFALSTSELYEPTEYEAKYEIRKVKNDYIEFRGGQIERPKTPKEQLLSWNICFDDEEAAEKRYIECIVLNGRNGRLLKNYSLDPKNFANYFTKSDLPFEISPIFFKAEVLDKYKNNHDKYDLTERTISCRGGWSLQTYDINEHNQVHTYAVYLARLPYKEQLHWLQYNEEPKGSISKRAFQTDIEGQFTTEISMLDQLQRTLKRLGKLKVGIVGDVIWSPKGGSWGSASKGLYYVNTENPNQWHDFIIALANATNEGFQTKTLRKIADTIGCTYEGLGPLGLIKLILQFSNNEDAIPVTYGILNDLQIRRGKGKAHGSWNTPEGSLIKDANKRLQAVILAIETLIKIFETLEIPIQKKSS